MVYVTLRQSPQYRQISMEELLFGDNTSTFINGNETNTRTYVVERPSERLMRSIDTAALTRCLMEFNQRTAPLREKKRSELYYTFYIPKHSGGLRRIDAPNEELMTALRELKMIFETKFHALCHTNAFAYIKNRSTIDAVKKHQKNESRWFAKYDLHNFFGSTTLKYVSKMFSMVFPFSELMKYPAGKAELETALSLCFLNGHLPQGTPISPLITNIMMIPFDHALSKKLHEEGEQNFVVTRYADDFIISSRYSFRFRGVEQTIKDTLKSFGAPFNINSEKTRYGSVTGSNWNLGVMLNKDNEITIGCEKHRQYRSMLFHYAEDKKKGISWPIEDVMMMRGILSYWRMVEGDQPVNECAASISRKTGVNVLRAIKDDLRS